ncbi:MAG: CbiX/SirB N-terminal domain-containing protein, partial [Halobacteriota archaeon]
MNETKRTNAVVVLTCILLLGVLTLSTGIASAEDSNLSELITAEELFELLSGNWSFNGTMTIGEQAMPTIGTRTVSLTGPTTADFVVVMEGEEGAETGEAWWDADKEKFAIKEGDEEPRYYDLLPNGYGSTYEMDGLPELGIMENVTCEERETFVDDNTTVKTWTAKNTTGIVVAKWEGTFTRVEEAPVEEYERIGILVVGHGSPSDSWCAPLRSVVANVSSPYPIELGFLELVPNETINIAVDKLDEAGVTKIIAVPLFISSHSGHIAEIEYVLG